MDMSGEEIHGEEPIRYPPVHVDLSDFPSYLGSPPASPFHGFDSEEMLPGRLVINTDTVDGNYSPPSGGRRGEGGQEEDSSCMILIAYFWGEERIRVQALLEFQLKLKYLFLSHLKRF